MSEVNLEHFLKQLNWRYATKLFDPKKKLPEALLEKLLDAARLSPSSYGLQPWHFVVVTDPKTRTELRSHAWNQPQITDSAALVVLCSTAKMSEQHVNHFADSIVKDRGIKPADIEGYRQMMLGLLPKVQGEAGDSWMTHQVYLALGMLLSACAIAEVDACPMEGFSNAEFDRVLNLHQKELRSRVLCAIGFRSAEDRLAQAKKVRAKNSEVFTRI